MRDSLLPGKKEGRVWGQSLQQGGIVKQINHPLDHLDLFLGHAKELVERVGQATANVFAG